MYSIKVFLPLVEKKGDQSVIDRLHEIWEKIDQAVNSHAWDGTRYNGGFDDNGIPFGDYNDNNRIILNSQSWAILAGAARGERLASVVKTIDSITTVFGTYVNYPPHTEWDSRWGRLSLKWPGTTENGAVYCHASMFKTFSDAELGDGKRLYDSLFSITPINKNNPVEVNLQLPTYLPNYYYSLENSPNFGRSSQAFNTGIVAWFLMATIEKLFGIQKTVDGIKLNPLLPSDWDNVEATRTFKNARYHVKYIKGFPGVTVNGEVYHDMYLPYADGAQYEVCFGI